MSSFWGCNGELEEVGEYVSKVAIAIQTLSVYLGIVCVIGLCIPGCQRPRFSRRTWSESLLDAAQIQGPKGCLGHRMILEQCG